MFDVFWTILAQHSTCCNAGKREIKICENCPKNIKDVRFPHFPYILYMIGPLTPIPIWGLYGMGGSMVDNLWSQELSAEKRSALWQALLLNGLVGESREAEDTR